MTQREYPDADDEQQLRMILQRCSSLEARRTWLQREMARVDQEIAQQEWPKWIDINLHTTTESHQEIQEHLKKHPEWESTEFSYIADDAIFCYKVFADGSYELVGATDGIYTLGETVPPAKGSWL